MSVVLTKETHKPSLEGMMPMVKNQKTITKVICRGKTQPSKAALNRFIEVYKQIVEENSRKEILKSNSGS